MTNKHVRYSYLCTGRYVASCNSSDSIECDVTKKKKKKKEKIARSEHVSEVWWALINLQLQLRAYYQTRAKMARNAPIRATAEKGVTRRRIRANWGE